MEGLPNNGRNIFNYTTLTPNVAIVQGPDGDEISIGGQRGIHNNVSVDGADFNNPFFGEQRGGQRPAFTFNLDAVQDFVVVADGANAEFGRSSGGFVNVITKSGTNEFHGSAHYFGKYDALSADYSHTSPRGGIDRLQPRFQATPVRRRRSAGRWCGTGPSSSWPTTSRNTTRPSRRTASARSIPRMLAFMDTAFGGALEGDFGPISRTNDANAFLGQARLPAEPEAQRHAQVQLHQLQPAERHLRRGLLGPERQRARERPLPRRERQPDLVVLLGALERVSLPVGSGGSAAALRWADQSRHRAPVPRYRHRLLAPDGSRVPDRHAVLHPGADAHDYRFQVLDNVSLVKGNHLFKFGGEWNRTGVNQTFRGLRQRPDGASPR